MHLFFRTRSREQRPVHEPDGRLVGWIRNQRGKHAGVLVVHVIKSDAVVGMKGYKAEFDAIGANHRKWRLRFADRGAKALCKS